MPATTRLADIRDGFAQVLDRATGRALGIVHRTTVKTRHIVDGGGGLNSDLTRANVELIRETPVWEAVAPHGHPRGTFATRAEAVACLAHAAAPELEPSAG